MSNDSRAERLRWVALWVLALSSSLNYLDRDMIAALLPTLRTEFGVGSEALGWLNSAFSIPYALSAPLMGIVIDRIGLPRGAAFVVGFWSIAGMTTGLTTGLTGLAITRALLGIGESGGIPATGKGSALYLPPEHRAFGSALSQVGLTLGVVAAPLITEHFSARFGWRAAFVFAGSLGFVWIPIWLMVASRTPALQLRSEPKPSSHRQILLDKRLQVLIIANMLSLTIYSLWSYWTTEFLVRHFDLTQRTANLHFTWWRAVAAALGGLTGSWLAASLIRSGMPVLRARLRVAVVASFFALATGLAPLVATPRLAIALVCVSIFATVCLSVNYYALPLDLFGASHAAFAVSLLTSSFGIVGAFLSPLIGRWSDQAGWTPVCLVLAFMPLLSTFILRPALRQS